MLNYLKNTCNSQSTDRLIKPFRLETLGFNQIGTCFIPILIRTLAIERSVDPQLALSFKRHSPLLRLRSLEALSIARYTIQFYWYYIDTFGILYQRFLFRHGCRFVISLLISSALIKRTSESNIVLCFAVSFAIVRFAPFKRVFIWRVTNNWW